MMMMMMMMIKVGGNDVERVEGQVFASYRNAFLWHGRGNPEI
jgi:hypothetical protein